MNQTIFITNRALNRGKNKKVSLFSEKLDANGELRYAIATPVDKKKTISRKISGGMSRPTRVTKVEQTFDLEVVESSNLPVTMQNIVANDNGCPWVFFLHGNNQSLKKNLIKSRKIQQEYNCNLVIYSWPSKSYEPYMLQTLAVGAALTANPTTALLGKLVLKKSFKRKIKQYKEARKHAEASYADFARAFEYIAHNIFSDFKQRGLHISLLVHSLGHEVLKRAIQEQPEQLSAIELDRVMLHQGDVQYTNHGAWVNSIPFSSQENTYITANKYDSVLLLSGLVNNNGNPLKVLTRLGNCLSEENRSNAKYIDFTDMPSVKFGHGIAWDENRSEQVDSICKQALLGASDG
ncbi:alpha/beta hydrolase [Vibrio methylphosphonaticus]|uniref:alpha/beta hydrolase n=1 Tax=Vibrio methylphosphonaticus TaxID=2946866 RepID=UPI00202A39BC|nr:alpha/beta hydrolase [Vibrio methylphosphonaticus]MCL9777279.1 alpha/beta hydrolase [Vibrio methylphosphonaticus]